MTVEHPEVAEIYARACGPLIGLLTVVGGSRSDAEEVAQDAFVKLLEHWPKVSRYEDVEGWLRTVALRMMISRHRRRAAATLGFHRLATRAREVAPDAGVEGRLDVDAALAALTPQARAVVVLHHVDDLPVAEIAELLRVPVGTVKSRLARARAALAPQFDERTAR